MKKTVINYNHGQEKPQNIAEDGTYGLAEFQNLRTDHVETNHISRLLGHL
jgi:hypothetical protein